MIESPPIRSRAGPASSTKLVHLTFELAQTLTLESPPRRHLEVEKNLLLLGDEPGEVTVDHLRVLQRWEFLWTTSTDGPTSCDQHRAAQILGIALVQELSSQAARFQDTVN